MIYEGGTHIWRVIYMDGRPHPDADHAPTRRGWDTRSGDGKATRWWWTSSASTRAAGSTWLGDPHTDRLHLVERFTRKDLYTLRYEATIDDPGAYTEPWTIGFDIVWDEKGEIQEYICQENSPWMRKFFAETAQRPRASGLATAQRPSR